MVNHFLNDFFLRTGKNFLWLSLSHLCGIILSFGGTIYLARILGPEGFGKIGFALAIAGFFMQIANMGVSVLGTRDQAQSMDKYKNNVQNIISFRIIQSFLSFSLLVLILVTVPISTNEIKLLILIFGTSLLFSPFDLKWFFQGIEKMQYIAFLNIVGQLSYVMLLSFFVRDQTKIAIVPLLYIIAQFLIPCLNGIILYSVKFKLLKPRLSILTWKTALIKTYPIGLSLIIGELYYIVDTVLLKFFKGAEEIGYYNSATKIIFMINAVAGIFASAVFPRLAASFKDSLESFRVNLAQTIKVATSVSLPVVLTGTLTSNHIIRLFYGENYVSGAIALQILVWMSAIYWLSIILFNVLIVINQQRKQFVIMTIGVALNIILNLLLIPFMGLIGASIASVSGFAVMLALAYFEINRAKILNKFNLNFFKRPLIACLGLTITLITLQNLNIFLLLPLAVSIYVGLLIVK